MSTSTTITARSIGDCDQSQLGIALSLEDGIALDGKHPVINSIAPWDMEEEIPLPQAPYVPETDTEYRLRHEAAWAAMDRDDRIEPHTPAPEVTAAHDMAPGHVGHGGAVGHAAAGDAAGDVDGADDDPRDPPPLSDEAIAAHDRDDRERDACTLNRDDELFQIWQHDCAEGAGDNGDADDAGDDPGSPPPPPSAKETSDAAMIVLFLRQAAPLNAMISDSAEPHATAPERTAVHATARDDADDLGAEGNVGVAGDADVASAARSVDDPGDVGGDSWDSPELTQAMIDAHAKVDIEEAAFMPDHDEQMLAIWMHDSPYFEPVPVSVSAPPGRKPVRSVRIAAPPPPLKLTVKEAALRMRCGVDSIRSRFRKLPGVEVEYRPEVLGAHRKRAYTTMLIPLAVMEREERRLGTR